MNYRGCNPTKFVLKGTPEELENFTAQKLRLIAAHYATVPFVCEVSTREECKRLSHLANSLVLLVFFSDVGEGDELPVVAVATSRAMMKAIASAAESSEGSTMSSALLIEAKVDGWLSFVWNSLDVPFQAAAAASRSSLLEDESSRISATETDKGIEEDLKHALKKIERHLSKKKSCRPALEGSDPMCLVPAATTTPSCSKKGTPYSLADFSLAITLHFMTEKGIGASAMSSEENPHLYRWKQEIYEVLGLA